MALGLREERGQKMGGRRGRRAERARERVSLALRRVEQTGEKEQKRGRTLKKLIMFRTSSSKPISIIRSASSRQRYLRREKEKKVSFTLRGQPRNALSSFCPPPQIPDPSRELQFRSSSVRPSSRRSPLSLPIPFPSLSLASPAPAPAPRHREL